MPPLRVGRDITNRRFGFPQAWLLTEELGVDELPVPMSGTLSGATLLFLTKQSRDTETLKVDLSLVHFVKNRDSELTQ